MKNARMLAAKLVILFTIITFICSGLPISALMLLNYVLLRPLNFKLFARVNYCLMYSLWSQIVALFDWVFSAKLRVYHKHETQQGEPMFAEHCVFLANHTYELDWIAAWQFTDKYSHLASCKAMLKDDLKYIPITGWTWRMSDQILLDRNWDKDKHKFSSAVDNLLKYEPMIATFFCEGARFTRQKAEACREFAKQRAIDAPKYHLIPRTKGWCEFVRLIKQRQARDKSLKVFVYNAQVAFEERGANSIAEILQTGKQPLGHLYFEKIDFDEVPADEHAAAKWLQDLYVAKDALHEHFLQHGRFPGFENDEKFTPEYRPRLLSLANWTFWLTFTLASLTALVMRCYATSGALYVSLVVTSCVLVSYGFLSYVIYEADMVENKQKKIVKERME